MDLNKMLLIGRIDPDKTYLQLREHFKGILLLCISMIANMGRSIRISSRNLISWVYLLSSNWRKGSIEKQIA